MTDEEFYKEALGVLKDAESYLLSLIGQYRDSSPIISCKSRIKSAQSMVEKLERQGFEITLQSALEKVYDAVGIRIICGFVDDVYHVSEWLENCSGIEIIHRKDYIAYPKPNGYRSLHLCLRIREGTAAGTLAEIQIRTMAIDFWATLEHRLKYKHKIPHEDLIRRELKRCADEIAATDMSMQTIRDMLADENF